MNRFTLIRDGNFTPLVRGVLCVVGIIIIFIGLEYANSLILSCIGFGIGAVGGISSRSAMLKIKPFDNEYQKAKKTYEQADDFDKNNP